MPTLSQLPKMVPLSSTGTLLAGAKAYWYETGTTTPKNTYTDFAMSVAHANPVVADAYGVFAPIYLQNDARYRLTLKTSADVLIYTVDDVGGPVVTQEELGSVLYPLSTAENTASVTPTDYYRVYGDVRRYGAVGDDSTNCASAITSAIAQMNQTGGAEIFFTAGTYRTSAALTQSTTGWRMRGEGWLSTIIKFTGATNGLVVSGRYGTCKGLRFQNAGSGLTGLICHDANSSIFEECYWGGPGFGWSLDGVRVNETFSSPTGNNNSIKFVRCHSNSNTGKGWSIPTIQADANAIEWLQCDGSSNSSHGLLIKGQANIVSGGIYEGNTGYGIQIAESDSGNKSTCNFIFKPYLESNAGGVYGGEDSQKNLIILDGLNASSGYTAHASAENIAITPSNTSGPILSIGDPLALLTLHSVTSGTVRAQLYATGSGTNIPLWLFGKGTGAVALDPFAASGVIVGADTLAATAALQVDSTTRGFLPPRMTGTQRDAISSPPDGLIVYNSTTSKLQVRAASTWVDLH